MATVLHADLDAFFASVEQRDHPDLVGRPVAVGGGVITAASYEARAHGVRAAMGAREARRRCPRLVIMPGRWEAYVAASRAVFEVFADTAPVVEAASIDEAFLDVSGMERSAGTGAEIAAHLRERVRHEVGLPLSVGVASTRALAKIASAQAKPDGMLALRREQELGFLHGLAVERIPGVGRSTAARLHAAGVVTVGDAAAAGEGTLVGVLGRARGRWLLSVAQNREPRRVRTRSRRAFGSQSAFSAATGRSPEAVEQRAIAVVDRVTRRMRRRGRRGRTVILRLRFADFERATRSRTLGAPTAESRVILATLRSLLADAEPLVRARGLTLVGVTVTGLEGDPEGEQLALALDEGAAALPADARALDGALDAVRDRFGTGAIARGNLLRGGPDLEPWMD